jgi:type VI secretion system secreted protein Hcp
MFFLQQGGQRIMLQEIFIKLDGIAGECKQAQHKGWIDVLNYSYGASQSASTAMGGGGGVGKADFRPLTFTHVIDRSTPNLFKYCGAGKHIPKVELSACKAGDGSQEFFNIKLFDVLIVEVSPNGSSGAETLESVSLAYSKIEIMIKEQNDNGSMGAAVHGNWNVKENREY